jgi:hypothetical protein
MEVFFKLGKSLGEIFPAKTHANVLVSVAEASARQEQNTCFLGQPVTKCLR